MNNTIMLGDCMGLSKDLEDKSINLVVTSPPYADMMSYGKTVKNYSVDEYVDWILPLFKESERFLKDTGSFILNINDKLSDGERQLYVFELVVRICKETNLKLYDRYIWYKKSSLPTPGDKRLIDRVEYIFHFVKDVSNFKSNMDDVRVPYKEISLQRFTRKMRGSNIIKSDGTATLSDVRNTKPHPVGKKPETVFRFNNAAISAFKDKVKHPAPFNPELPDFFIRWLTDKGDVVLDPFMGSGSTAVACKTLNRRWIGFDINPTYIEMTKNRVRLK